MAGLLDGVLPYVYSQSDRAKRALLGLLADPVGTAQQAIGNANDRAGGLLAMTRAAADEGLNNGPATQALAGTLANAYNPAGMIVYHGSPHVFNAFDASKIGTGEGAQAYGHGLYFAESPEVAATYSPTVPARYIAKDGSSFKPKDGYQDAMLTLVSQYGTAENALAAMGPNVPPSIRQALQSMIASGVAVKPASKAALYKVDLPDSAIARMLDWDKPLSQQPVNVRESLSRLASTLPEPTKNISRRNRAAIVSGDAGLNGGDAYFNLGGYNAAGATSDLLRQAGIPGIRYLDGGSRGAGVGTSNFVVFPGEENMLSILERNGVPLR